MKQEFTRKALYESYGKKNIIIVQSEDLWSRVEPTAYWAGVYGWNCDIVFGRTHAYVHGYRPCGTRFKGTLEELQEMMSQDNVFYR